MNRGVQNHIPEEALKWKSVDDYVLRTSLGEDVCKVQMLDSSDYTVLRAGEDDRVRKAQIRLFCDWLIQEKESFGPEQLRYILVTLQIKQSTLAKAMALTEGSVSQFLHAGSGWKPSTHRQVALLFLGELRDPWSIHDLSNNQPPIDELIDRIPVRELSKRGWIPDGQNVGELRGHVVHFFRTPRIAANFVRFRSTKQEGLDPILVGCWIQHLKNRASNEEILEYDRSLLLHCVPQLLELTSDPSRLAESFEILARCGVHLFIEKKLDGSSFDGAVFFHNKNPVIGLTLRYDRIDWFWFTLLHEIGHLILDHDLAIPHIDKEPERDADGDENAANQWASNQLAPEGIGEEFVALRGSIKGRVQGLAKKYNRHEGIIVGRLQFESKIEWNQLANMKIKVSSFLGLESQSE